MVLTKRALFQPECAKGLLVDLLDENDKFLCSGLLLRDDLVLADQACARTAHTAVVLQPDEPLLLHHNDIDASLSLQRRAILEVAPLDQWTALATIEMPTVHFQSGWPRTRAFLLHDNEEPLQKSSIWDASTRILELEEGGRVHFECFGGELPVISLSDGDLDHSAIEKVNQDILLFPKHRRRIAPMSNMLGEKWWVYKKGREPLVHQLFSRYNLYASVDQNKTLDIIRAGGEDYHTYLLEAEDPRVRNAYTLGELYTIWQNQHPFSGEPFFEWLDFGSGRWATYEEYSRSELEEDYCEIMDEETRRKAVVIPEVIDQEVILRYEVAGLPVEGGDMLFVWGLDSNLYVAQNGGANFHHMCFFGGRPVRFAGEIVVGDHGALREVWADSGHYKPTDWHYRLFYRHLKTTLPDMTNDMIKWVNEHTDKKTWEWKTFLFAP